MKTSTQLEQELQQVKKLEKQNSLEEQLQKLMYLKGKSFSTHQVGRKTYTQKEISVRKVHDIFIKNEEICYDLETISYMGFVRPGKKTADKNDQVHKYEISRSDYHHSYTSSYQRFQFEITDEQFETAKKYATAAAEMVGECIRSAFIDPVPREIISQGDHTQESNEIEFLKRAAVPVIDLSDWKEKVPGCNLTMNELISWNWHPLCIAGRYLINNQYSKEICQQIYDKIYKNASSWGGSIWNRDKPRLDQLNKFINSVNWLP